MSSAKFINSYDDGGEKAFRPYPEERGRKGVYTHTKHTNNDDAIHALCLFFSKNNAKMGRKTHTFSLATAPTSTALLLKLLLLLLLRPKPPSAETENERATNNRAYEKYFYIYRRRRRLLLLLLLLLPTPTKPPVRIRVVSITTCKSVHTVFS